MNSWIVGGWEKKREVRAGPSVAHMRHARPVTSLFPFSPILPLLQAALVRFFLLSQLSAGYICELASTFLFSYATVLMDILLVLVFHAPDRATFSGITAVSRLHKSMPLPTQVALCLYRRWQVVVATCLLLACTRGRSNWLCTFNCGVVMVARLCTVQLQTWPHSNPPSVSVPPESPITPSTSVPWGTPLLPQSSSSVLQPVQSSDFGACCRPRTQLGQLYPTMTTVSGESGQQLSTPTTGIPPTMR